MTDSEKAGRDAAPAPVKREWAKPELAVIPLQDTMTGGVPGPTPTDGVGSYS